MVRSTGRSRAAALALGVVGALVLAACGGEATVGGESSNAAPAAATAGASVAASAEPGAAPASSAAVVADFPTPNGGDLNLYNWSDYIPPDEIKRFEDETGIKVHLDVFDSNDSMIAKLQAGGANYDVIVPTDYAVAQLIDLGMLEEVDPASFPNGQYIKPEQMSLYFDPGRKYSAPFMYGTTGIAYDPTKTGGEITSWADYYAADNPAAGSMSVLNGQNDIVNSALRAVGAQPCSTNRDDYIKVEALLNDFKPNLKVISSDGTIARMTSGETSEAMMWNGDYHRAAKDNKNLAWVYPAEGLTMWVDNFAVPKGAQNLDNAKIFINWMMDPKNIAEASDYTAYDNGITGSVEFMDPGLASDPAIATPAEQASLLQSVPQCPQEAVDLYTKVFTDFKKG